MPFCFHPAAACLASPTVFLRLPPAVRAHAFSTTATLSAESREPTLYELLGVPVTATTSEIKKKFYSLSLEHHPDRKPEDPEAHSKFASISSAYQTLSNTTKRARYDREHDIHRQASAPGASGLRGTSPHRGSYAGSRPPSGLSRQRGPFRGPPPSFYAHGGYGSSAAGQQHSHAHQQSQSSKASSKEDPTSFIHHNPVPHFDASSHFRTQMHEDARRRMRRKQAVENAKKQARERGADVDEDVGSVGARFFAVMGLIVIATMGTNLAKSFETRSSGQTKIAESTSGSKAGSNPGSATRKEQR